MEEAIVRYRRYRALHMQQHQQRIRHAAGAINPVLKAGDIKRQIRYERINVDGEVLSYSANENGQVGVFVAAQPLSQERNYFEVEILDTGFFGAIGVGLVPSRYPLDSQPGWIVDSVAYHADDGKLFKSNGHGRPFGSKCHSGDIVGCGIKFDQAFEGDDERQRRLVPVFFTRNGREVGTVLAPMPGDGLFPAVGMHSEGEEVKINLDIEWQHQDVILMSIDNTEEEWSRLHDVRVNGQVGPAGRSGLMLEYTGRGKSIIDVGLAQARWPLDTTNHYFEIEVVDPGESCYIAIGLARRDYPKHRHPGWNKGSIAYHADDGKIFIGSGVGDPFGPRCHKGDIMGCGILFPRDYSSELDSDGSQDASPDGSESPDDLLELELDSESEDEEWWERPCAENGTKVQVFFTRNGKTIGRRETRIPRGGFYPTVGMLSSDEKVKVDLRPLTG
ncbi:SPRY domain-containing protein 3-like isoform X2 [Lineus longissimus]|uniref:SPRY domain-containing protein 3-like isoform X2 n=1 Tax=Lineus longissimus TaxID=88925 RepID=UPI00315CC931